MQENIPISVDKDFARFGNKSYAINKINSVEVRARHPHGQGAVVLFGLLAIFSLLATPSAGGQMVVIATFFGALTVWAWRRSKVVEYQLFLMTSSSEAQAISSLDGEMIGRLRNRIERAMSGQLA